MPKSLRLVLLMVLAFARFSRAQVSPTHSDLRVGFGSVDLVTPAGVPLAGYGSSARRTFRDARGNEYAKWFKPSSGTHDAIRSKAMDLVQGDKKLLFVKSGAAGRAVDM